MLSEITTLAVGMLAWGLFWGGACLALCAARLARAPRLLLLAALACGLHECLLALPPWPQLAAMLRFAPSPELPSPLYHPVDWSSKVAGILLSALLVYGLRWATPSEAGVRWPQPGSLRVVGLVMSLVAAVLFTDAYLSRHAFGALWWHERLFFAIAPGVEEELFYRGALLGLLGRVFPRTIPLPGARTSWGGVVGVLLFTLGHGIQFPTYYHYAGSGIRFGYYLLSLLHFTPAEVFFQLAMGTLFLWVRERTGSVWAAATAHCLANTCLVLGHLPG